MISWLDIFKHLLPRARSWRITIDKTLRRFFDGLTQFPEDIRVYFNSVLLDIWARSTTALDLWFEQFNLVRTGDDSLDGQSLEAAWILNETQAPRVIEDALQAAGFDVYLHEWWFEPVVTDPILKNPFAYLASETFASVALAGEPLMQSGEPDALCGNIGVVPVGLSLVSCDEPIVCCDDPIALCDNIGVSDGRTLVNNTDVVAPNVIPEDPAFWPNFMYIGGQNFPDFADVPEDRRGEFETLLLKISPTEQWIGLLINYV